MNERAIALRIIARLQKPDDRPAAYPWLLLGNHIWSQAELSRLSDAEVKQLFDRPEYWVSAHEHGHIAYTEDPYDFVWGYRAAHRSFIDKRPRNALTINRPRLHPDSWHLAPYPFMLFWPPAAVGRPPEMAWWETLCTKEAALDGCYWLAQQSLTPYTGPRVAVYYMKNSDYATYWDMSTQQRIKPIPLDFQPD